MLFGLAGMLPALINCFKAKSADGAVVSILHVTVVQPFQLVTIKVAGEELKRVSSTS